MTKKLSLFLAIVFVLTGCLAGAFAAEVPEFGKFEEPIHITYLSTDQAATGTSNYDANDPTRKSPTENAWIDGYKEFLNIELERIIAEDSTALNARVNTGIASGDLPDIMLVDKSMFYVLAENGVLADLSEAYDNYAYKNYLTQIEESYPTLKQVGMYEGEMLGYGRCGNCYNGTAVLWVRQDWLDKVGKTIPTTIDELVDVAQAFVDAKLGGENTVGLEFYNIGDAIIAAYGAVMGAWNQQADGSYVKGDVMPEVKDGLLKMQEIYQKGLIKSDFAVAGTVDEDISNGVCGLLISEAWRGVTCIQTNFNNDPDAVWVPVQVPTLDGNPVKLYTNNTVGSFLCVNAEFEHPEALFMLVEFENAMRFSPDPEICARFNVCEDGYQMWNIGAFRDTIRADTDLYKGRLIREGLANNTPTEDMNAIALSNYELCLKAKEGDRAYLGRLIAFTEGYSVVDPLLDGGYLLGAYNGPITENMTLYEGSINEALKAAMIKVIMGDDISVYEEAVDTWYTSGGQAITDEVNEYYKSLT